MPKKIITSNDIALIRASDLFEKIESSKENREFTLKEDLLKISQDLKNELL